MAKLNHTPPWSIFVETTISSDVETIMNNLGFGSTEYMLKTVFVNDLPEPCFATLQTISQRSDVG